MGESTATQQVGNDDLAVTNKQLMQSNTTLLSFINGQHQDTLYRLHQIDVLRLSLGEAVNRVRYHTNECEYSKTHSGECSCGLADFKSRMAAAISGSIHPSYEGWIAALERFESEGEDFVKLSDVRDMLSTIQQDERTAVETLASIDTRRICIEHEYEGPTIAKMYEDQCDPVATAEGITARAAIAAVIEIARLKPVTQVDNQDDHE